MISLDAKIEALLFWKAESVSTKKLGEILGVSVEEIEVAVQELQTKLAGRGLSLLRFENDITLGTAKNMSAIIEQLTKEELVKDLGKAGLETISIILYQGPISRAEIDYIRGVNSNFIIRNLLIRGLVEKVSNPKDQRSFLYKPTLELLSFLGTESTDKLPEYEKVRADIAAFKDNKEVGDTTTLTGASA